MWTRELSARPCSPQAAADKSTRAVFGAGLAKLRKACRAEERMRSRAAEQTGLADTWVGF